MHPYVRFSAPICTPEFVVRPPLLCIVPTSQDNRYALHPCDVLVITESPPFLSADNPPIISVYGHHLIRRRPATNLPNTNAFSSCTLLFAPHFAAVFLSIGFHCIILSCGILIRPCPPPLVPRPTTHSSPSARSRVVRVEGPCHSQATTRSTPGYYYLPI